LQEPLEIGIRCEFDSKRPDGEPVTYSELQLRERLDRLPRLRLAALPTPLEPLDRLSAELGGPRILVKREDLTGLALGGNKIREFEYSVAQAVEQECDVLVHGAASQSNQSRVTAAVAARLGLRCVIVGRADAHARLEGNLLLTHLFGAEIHLHPAAEQNAALEMTLNRLRSEGHQPFNTSSDGYPFRSIAYVDGFLEMWDQLQRRGATPAAVYVATGIHTYLGMVVAARALGLGDLRFVAVDIATREAIEAKQAMAGLAREICHVLDIDLCLEPHDFEICSDFVGPGYGIVTDAGRQAIELTARRDGLILDPSYTGKAMAALISHIREGRWAGAADVVFIHTGGIPALFSYAGDLDLHLDTETPGS